MFRRSGLSATIAFACALVALRYGARKWMDAVVKQALKNGETFQMETSKWKAVETPNWTVTNTNFSNDFSLGRR